jgi:hypothetical protein
MKSGHDGTDGTSQDFRYLTITQSFKMAQNDDLPHLYCETSKRSPDVFPQLYYSVLASGTNILPALKLDERRCSLPLRQARHAPVSGDSV